MPNQPKTPRRSFRIPDDLYQRVRTKADDNDENVSDVIRRLLLEYVQEDEPTDDH